MIRIVSGFQSLLEEPLVLCLKTKRGEKFK